MIGNILKEMKQDSNDWGCNCSGGGGLSKEQRGALKREILDEIKSELKIGLRRCETYAGGKWDKRLMVKLLLGGEEISSDEVWNGE